VFPLNLEVEMIISRKSKIAALRKY